MTLRPFAAVAAFGALLLLPGLGRMGALDSTDARYLAIGREMWRTGEWWIPRLAGAPHLDKPPLAYWSAALGFELLGAGEGAGRLVQQLAFLATALVVLHGALRLGAGRWSIVAPLALLGMGLPFALSRGLAADHLQLAFLTPALLLLHDAAARGSAARAAAAFACLGASMLAKGPIALLVAAIVWSAWALAARGAARVPLRGVALGALAFAAIGLPWYAAVAQQWPDLLGWYLEHQLASRVTGGGAGHAKDAAYLLRAWLLGLLPWTPLALLALARIAPRRGRDAIPGGAFLVAWAIAPVIVFSLFATKLAGYVLPVFPAAALAIAVAGGRGLLGDRTARAALAFGWCATALVAAVAGAAILAEQRLGLDGVPRIDVSGAPTATLCGALLLVLGGALAASATRALRGDSLRAHAALALGSATTLALAFHAVAPDLPSLRGAAELVLRVPGARVIELSFKPSLFFYADGAADVRVAGVRGIVEPFLDPAEAVRLTATREDAAHLWREDAPAFVLADHGSAEALARDERLASVYRTHRYQLLANPAASRALQATAR